MSTNPFFPQNNQFVNNNNRLNGNVNSFFGEWSICEQKQTASKNCGATISELYY